MPNKWWLLLEKSDETRISKGIDAYQDDTGRAYHYDSLVPNHRNLATGDVVLVRKEDEVIGWGVIGSIEATDGLKIHRRCPSCSGTDVRERKTKSPKWKCGKCAAEFMEPTETETPVRSYVATIDGFSLFDQQPDVRSVKRCAIAEDGEKSQLSMIQLRPETVLALVRADPPRVTSRDSAEKPSTGGQGFGLTVEQRRAVELCAMAVARTIYERDGWIVDDKSNGNPFDLLATKAGQRRFIEVKGTTGDGATVILTHGEVAHACSHATESAIVVVGCITLSDAGGAWRADGGRVVAHHDPWCPDRDRLMPTEYRYNVPAGSCQ